MTMYRNSNRCIVFYKSNVPFGVGEQFFFSFPIKCKCIHKFGCRGHDMMDLTISMAIHDCGQMYKLH